MRPAGDYRFWYLMGGRGSGKTETGARETIKYLRTKGRGARAHIIAPTIGDVNETCLNGPSGLVALFGDEFVEYKKTTRQLIHYLGGYVKAFGGDEPARLRGPQCEFLWVDEVQLLPEETWSNADMGHRLGNPYGFLSGTPLPCKIVKDLVKQNRVVITRGRTQDAFGLPESKRIEWIEKYGGTRLGRQELDGELLDDVEGAFWRNTWIDDNRVVRAPELLRLVLSVDPAITSGKNAKPRRRKPDETAACVAGLGVDGDYYVLASEGWRVEPSSWAARVVELARYWGIGVVYVENNQGGDMVTETLRAADDKILIKTFFSTQSKSMRAEPVSLLYEQGRVHHVGIFKELEEQQTAFPVATEYDDRVDSLTAAVNELHHGARLNAKGVAGMFNRAGNDDLTGVSGWQ